VAGRVHHLAEKPANTSCSKQRGASLGRLGAAIGGVWAGGGVARVGHVWPNRHLSTHEWRAICSCIMLSIWLYLCFYCCELKVYFGEQTGVSVFIYELVEWEVVCGFELQLKEYYEIDKINLKCITAWHLFRNLMRLPNPSITCKHSVGTYRTQSPLNHVLKTIFFKRKV
jgi:hypothetical protein